MMSNGSAKPAAVLGMGNPLLDMIAIVPESFLSKYDVKLNNAILADEKHLPVYADIEKNFEVEYLPGGATQNSIRVCQALLGHDYLTSYIGCIGKDQRGEEMKKLAMKEKITAFYKESNLHNTGVCAVLVNGGERSLVTNLGAANDYSVDHLKEEKVWDRVEKSQIIYSSGYFLTVSPEATVISGEHCAENGKIYCLNLGAPFIVEFFKEAMMNVMPYVDFLFGNESEFLAFGKQHNFQTEDMEEIASLVVKLPKVNNKKSRVVVVTQGEEPTIVATKWATGGIMISKFPVEKLETSMLVDTNGAGDAFVGGFLFGLAEGKNINECVYFGSRAARHVLQKSGCKFDFTEEKPMMMAAVAKM